MLDSMIRLENASLTFPNGVVALADLNVAVRRGEFVFLVGPTGAGKSSFLRLITRELIPSSGRVLVNGLDLNILNPAKLPFLRRKIGVVYQDFKLFPKKTVYENIAYVLEVIGTPQQEIPAKVEQALSTVNLSDKKSAFPDQLSGGEQQRASIARSLVNNPLIILADEPSGNLDPVNTLAIFSIFEEINARGTTVLVATHDEPVVDRLKKRVIGIVVGKISFDRENSPYIRASSLTK